MKIVNKKVLAFYYLILILLNQASSGTCGNGIIETGEVCDDSNTTNGDGCSSACAVESGFTCTTANPSVCSETCGDSKNMGKNACDDGNTASGDGCSSACAVETGFSCSGGSSTSADTCTEICGDSKNMGKNACDDGNTASGDGCSSSCAIESGWTCSGGTTTTKDTCTETCGDGKNMGGRACDDGNTSSGDGCSSTCTVESGYSCSGGSSTTADTCSEICGDSKKLGILACDDGNTVSGDGCSSVCAIETGWTCSGGTTTSKDTCAEVCGDGLDFGKYGCDDGNKVSGDGCSSTCSVETGYSCSGGTTSTPDTCTEVCGDGKNMGKNACDDGNTSNGDGCSSTCTVETGYKCSGGTTTTKDSCYEICGDGLDMGKYACDDGNTKDGDGCSQYCTIESGYICSNGTSTQADYCTLIQITSGSYSDCQTFANYFSNTCSSTTAVSLSTMASSAQSCTNVGLCPGTSSGTTCSWTRKLCVTCYLQNGLTMIRVQTNAQPDHCFYTPTQTPATNLLDFQVVYNGFGLSYSTYISSQTKLDSTLCINTGSYDYLIDKNLHFYSNSGSTNYIVGVALNGVPFFAGTSEKKEDAYFPTTISNKVSSDMCLGNSEYTSFYHYYSFSPCILTSTVKSVTSGSACSSDTTCSSDPMKYAFSYVTSSYKKLTPIGIAKDGHWIYGPYKDDGTLWQPCDVDICNQVIINGYHAYVATTFHPYIVGCWGPGPRSTLQATCSTNPRTCTFSEKLQIWIMAIAVLNIIVLIY